ncbi:MAG: hypothetical protein MZW92_46950 [Comamonadaceae bacterium]|nr:hypothetical protein [Comamonadaceae bacterium]
MVDTMIPIGKGQRQLIIGDAGTGKSALALDAVVAQKGRAVLCVYVLVSQKRSAVVATVAALRQAGVLDITCVVVAEATATPGLKFLAPFAGCAIAERHGCGPGATCWWSTTTSPPMPAPTASCRCCCAARRGARPIPATSSFCIRVCWNVPTCLSAHCGGGSMTALPIVETDQGEIAAYIPTNLISITDGQIYLDPALFARGFLPAIDITRSVSRIGGKAQYPAIKAEAGRMKLDFLQFLELEVFTRFGSRLEAGSRGKDPAWPDTAGTAQAEPAGTSVARAAHGLARGLQRRTFRRNRVARDPVPADCPSGPAGGHPA